jgi:hypothetical protein
MDIGRLTRTAELFVTKNSTTILTAFGVTGTIATAVLAAKASFEATGILNFVNAKHRHEQGEAALEDPTIILTESAPLQVQAKAVWKLYAPAAVMGTTTVMAIVGSHRISTRRHTALAVAYNLTARYAEEMKAKVIEVVGEKKAAEIREAVTHDRIMADPKRPTLEITGKNVYTCDEYSMRYFSCDVETLKRAVSQVNKQIAINGYASLSDFYDEIHIDRTAVSDQLGWNHNIGMLEIEFDSGLINETTPYLVYAFNYPPTANYHRFI